MITVFLEGELGANISKEWKLGVRTVADALRAIQANTGNFLGSVIKSKNQYVVMVDGKPVENTASLHMRVKKSIHFIPVLGGTAVVIPAFIEAVIAVKGFLAAHLAWYAALDVGIQYVIAALIVIGGYALISYGISLLVESIMDPGDPDRRMTSSFLFTGPQNVASQGDVVPIAYGRLLVGSKIISVAMSSGDKTKDNFIIQNTLNNQGITRNKEGGLMATRRLISSIA